MRTHRLPHALLDHLLEAHGIPNDRQLALRIGVTGPELSKIRTGVKTNIDRVALAIHETFGLPFDRIRELSGTDVGIRRLHTAETKDRLRTARERHFFEQWAQRMGFNVSRLLEKPNHYAATQTEFAWLGWSAAKGVKP